MKQQPWVSFVLAGVNLTEFGLQVPSPFVSLELSNSEIQSMTSWVLNVSVAGDQTQKSNVAAFEALLYSAAQAASRFEGSSGIPVSFSFGWLTQGGQIQDYISYQGFSIKFKVSTNGMYMNYQVTGFASLSVQSSMPVLRIPAISGFVQPSAILQALATSVKATDYYTLDIDRNDAPTYISHTAINTSFNKYVRGDYTGEDDYETFPGLLPMSKSYSATRDSAGLATGVKSLSQVLNNITVSPVSNFLKSSLTDTTPQCSTFSYWVDEPTMTQPGVIHYKSNAGLLSSQSSDILEYGTSTTNIFSLSGSYDGVAYNIADLRFSQVGFTVDGSGNTIAETYNVVNSWSNSLEDVFQSASIINDINAIATQFSGDFTVQIPGSAKRYTVAQPVTLLVVSGGTISPVTGVYNIISVSHQVSNTFITTLKLKRLVMSTANQVAMSQGIFVGGSGHFPQSSVETTSNIITPYKVDLGTMYPDFTHLYSV